MVKRIGRDISIDQPEIATSPLRDGIEPNQFIDMIDATPGAPHSDHDKDVQHSQNDDNHKENEHQVNNENCSHQESDGDITVNDEVDEGAETNANSNPRSIPSYSRIATLFKKRDIQKLASQISAIDSQLPHEFIKYKDAVEKKERLGDDLISQVLQQNEKLKSRVIQLKTKIDKMKTENKNLHAETKITSETNDNANNDAYTDQLKLSFLELLTGVKCDEICESNGVLTLKITQSGSKSLKHSYHLVINESDNKHATYYPKFTEESVPVKKQLPEYLHSSITFPIEAIRFFHQKVAESLI